MDIEIPIQALHEKFVYNRESGDLLWRVSTGKAKAGSPAGCKARVERNEYLKVTVFRIQTYAHRIAWAMEYGYWPIGIDHQDGNGLNNRLINLREASTLENSRNLSRSKANTSGVTGVLWLKRVGKWRAGIKVSGVYHSLGSYVDINDAIRVRKQAEANFGFHENHDRSTT